MTVDRLDDWRGADCLTVDRFDVWRGADCLTVDRFDVWRGADCLTVDRLDDCRGADCLTVDRFDDCRGADFAWVDRGLCRADTEERELLRWVEDRPSRPAAQIAPGHNSEPTIAMDKNRATDHFN